MKTTHLLYIALLVLLSLLIVALLVLKFMQDNEENEATLQSSLKELQHRMQSCQDLRTATEAKLADAIRHGNQLEKQLRVQVNESQTNLQDINNKVAELEDELRSSVVERDGLEQTMRQLEKEVSTLQQMNKEKEEELTKVMGILIELENVTNEQKTVIDAHIAAKVALEERLDQYEKQQRVLEQSIVQKDQKINQLKGLLDLQRKNNAKQEEAWKELNDAQTLYDQQEIKAKKEIARLKARLGELKKDNEELSKEYNSLLDSVVNS